MSIRDEVREARLAREARDAARRASSSGSRRNAVDPERGRRFPRASLFGAPSLAPRPPSSYRLTALFGRSVAAAASTAVGHAREGAANALAAARGTPSTLVSNERLRRIVDRIAADRAAFDSTRTTDERLDAAVRGLSEAEIAKLRDVVWEPATSESKKQTATSGSGDGDGGDGDAPVDEKEKKKVPDECAVCFVAFEPGDALKSLPCGHAGFHLACIRAWLERSPTCPLCRCACRAADPGDVPGDVPGDGDHPGEDPDLRSETFERHLAELTAMHEEESAWLDRLEAQPRRSATAASGDAATRAPAGDIPGDDARALVVGSSRDAPFDPGAASYMRRNYAELVRLREEERALVARLDRLAATEEDLHARIAEATRRRDDALRARENETETRTDLGVDGTTSFALAAAERDHHSRVNAVDALARWRR